VRRILDLTGVSITVPVSESLDEALSRVDAHQEEQVEPAVQDGQQA
jgi:stage II sporulation protein AA (anti-sigma F factor antagonist)